MTNLVSHRHLDALVAKDVFGEPKPKKVPKEPHGFNVFEQVYSKKGAWVVDHDYDKGDFPIWYPLRFSSDIVLGFKVVHKINELFDVVVGLKQINIKNGGLWVCTFNKRIPGNLLATSFPNSNAAWAICDAALTLVRK